MNSAERVKPGEPKNSPLEWQFVFVKNRAFRDTWTGTLHLNKNDHVSLKKLDGTCDIFNINPDSYLSIFAAHTILRNLGITPTDENIERLIKLFFKKLDLEQEVISIPASEILKKIGS